ncbi:hypothetical protein G4313_05975 [Coprococcus eutactus]|uniref:hypothetical protein n=1 Tax=Coprococcus sp. HCN-4056 TaxID=3134671 RepID=UPI00156EB9C0|nr:hypothetical protein [Coprococcus eutactus]
MIKIDMHRAMWIGAVATYTFASDFINIAGINAVVWGLLVGGILSHFKENCKKIVRCV